MVSKGDRMPVIERCEPQTIRAAYGPFYGTSTDVRRWASMDWPTWKRICDACAPDQRPITGITDPAVTNSRPGTHNPIMSRYESNQFSSSDASVTTQAGPIVGVEDSDGNPWCMSCAASEIRSAGHAAFDMDLHELGNRRTKCSQCGEGIAADYHARHAR